MAEDDSHFRLRLPRELKAWIEAEAANNKRSINAEVVALLAAQMKAESLDEHLENLDASVDDHERRLDKLEAIVRDLYSAYRGRD